ncbi:MAG: hypothetical protein MJ245_06940 [Clostridia bacterium]|nr:hypothetical protein [Clostridia bacterium]
MEFIADFNDVLMKATVDKYGEVVSIIKVFLPNGYGNGYSRKAYRPGDSEFNDQLRLFTNYFDEYTKNVKTDARNLFQMYKTSLCRDDYDIAFGKVFFLFGDVNMSLCLYADGNIRHLRRLDTDRFNVYVLYPGNETFDDKVLKFLKAYETRSDLKAIYNAMSAKEQDKYFIGTKLKEKVTN